MTCLYPFAHSHSLDDRHKAMNHRLSPHLRLSSWIDFTQP